MHRFSKIALATFVMVIGITLSSSGLARAVAAHVWPAERFGHCTDDPRIFCEAGSEPFARTIANLLPAAVAQVERGQYGAFLGPVRIYVYSSLDTYALYSGTRGGAGVTSFGEVHLAPRMQTVPMQYAALLAHELSHLHFVQRVGPMTMMRLPNWFTEGWATLTSQGGGAGGISQEQAVFALVHGRHFTPRDTESLLSPATASDFHLSGAMYYRQASLLVSYLQRRDPKAFKDMIRGIETGQSFESALFNVYRQSLSVLWQDFRADVRLHPAARSEHG